MRHGVATLSLVALLAGGCANAPKAVEPRPVAARRTVPPEAEANKQALELTPPPERPDTCDDGFRFAECAADPEAPGLRMGLLSSMFEATASHGVSAPYDDALDRFVVADIARGVRLVDTRTPGSPVVTELMQLRGHPTAVRVAGDRALVQESSTTDDYANELTWLSLSPTTVRAKLQTLAAGNVRAVYAVSGTAQGMVVVLVTEEVQRTGECVRRTSTTLRKIELRDDGIYELASLDLGKDVAAIWRSGDWLLVSGQAQQQRGSMLFVRIRNGRRELEARATHQHAPDAILGFDATKAELRVAGSRHVVNPDGPPYYLYGRAILATFAVRPTGEIEGTATCEYERSSKPKNDTAELVDPLFVERVSFVNDGALLTVYEEGDLTTNPVIVDGKACRRTKLPGGIVLAGSDDRLLAISSPAESLALELYYRDHAEPSAPYRTLHAQLSERQAPRGKRSYQGHSAYAPRDAYAQPAGKLPVLAIPYREHDAQGRLRAGDQLVFSTPAGGVLGPKLEGLLWLTNAAGRAVVQTATGLQIVQLREGEPARALDDLVLWPAYSSGIFVDSAPTPTMRGRVARLRAIGEPAMYDPHADAPMGQLEIVAGDVNVEYGPALATFPISANASLRSEGNLVIASSQAATRDGEVPSGACHITTIDAAAKPAPRKVGFHVTNEPCPWQPTLETAVQEREANSNRDVFRDEMVLDVTDEEALLLRYGSLRRSLRNVVRLD
jgi:hypothetical protein